jgi:GNAT superfamily N-acetyltransferase
VTENPLLYGADQPGERIAPALLRSARARQREQGLRGQARAALAIAHRGYFLSGEIAGILVLLEEEDHLLLDNVAVDPRHQGKGVGRALIDFAEQEARRRSHAEIRLYTHQAMHENIALYPRLGYEETGRAEQAGFQRVFFRKTLR